MKRALAIAVGVLGCLAAPGMALAATYTVNTTADEFSSGPHCAGAPSDCSIRQAADLANADDAADTIVIPAGRYVLKFNGITFFRQATIVGAGARSTIIDGDGGTGVFDFGNPDNNSTPPIELRDVTVTGSGGGIGAIRVGTDVTILRTAVSGNATNGVNIPFQGEGLPTALAPETRIVDSTISDNTAGAGAGVNGGFGAVTVINSTITSNTANNGPGGGIAFDPSFGQLTIGARRSPATGRRGRRTRAATSSSGARPSAPPKAPWRAGSSASRRPFATRS